MAIMVIVAPLKSEDRPAWEELARGYKAFYRTPATDAQYEAAWRQLRDEGSGLCGLGAYLGGRRAESRPAHSSASLITCSTP